MRQTARTLFTLGIPVILLSTLAGCQQGISESQQKVMLWNGKDFSGWKLYVADKDVNVNDIWSVRDGVVYCKGKPNGYMRTKSMQTTACTSNGAGRMSLQTAACCFMPPEKTRYGLNASNVS